MFQYSNCIGRITSANIFMNSSFVFQYSNCIGRIPIQKKQAKLQNCFNTPIVSVEFSCLIALFTRVYTVSILQLYRQNKDVGQLQKIFDFVFQYSNCIGRIQITTDLQEVKESQFQYSNCIGRIHYIQGFLKKSSPKFRLFPTNLIKNKRFSKITL